MVDDGTESFKEESRLAKMEGQAEIGSIFLEIVKLELEQKQIASLEFDKELVLRKLAESPEKDEIGKKSRVDKIGELSFQMAELRDAGTKLYRQGLIKGVELNKLLADYLPIPKELKVKVRVERE